MKIKTFKNAYVTWDVSVPSGMIVVKLRCNNGMTDTVRCDSREAARNYWKSFCLIAKQA